MAMSVGEDSGDGAISAINTTPLVDVMLVLLIIFLITIPVAIKTIKVKVLDVVVEPGETVFLPLGWWHQVTALDVSLSFSFSNLALPNHYSFNNPTITNW